jgi:hypothetical protein
MSPLRGRNDIMLPAVPSDIPQKAHAPLDAKPLFECYPEVSRWSAEPQRLNSSSK